jgi:hypothetical protein
MQEEFAILTNIIHREWSGLTVTEHKKIKKLKGHNLRDNMTDAELLFTSLTEMTTRQVAEKDLSVGLDENSVAAKKCGKLAGRAKDDFEKVIGRKVIS